jgi:hypothetical protein
MKIFKTFTPDLCCSFACMLQLIIYILEQHRVFHICFVFRYIMEMDTYDKLTTQLFDKWDDFNFFIVNFPYLCSNIASSPAYGVYISQLIQ